MINRVCISVLAVSALASYSVRAQSPEEVALIEAAAPSKATVKPAQPRNVLVFSLALGFQHASIPHGEKAFEILGKKSGAYSATLSRDVRSFEAENLAKFDAIIFNNTTGDLFTTPSLQKALMDFVRSGKGVVGIHSASDACYNWQPFGEMMGGYFNGHPWTAESTVTLKIDAPKHPVAAAFDGNPFTVVDEIYQFKEPYSRLAVRVLTSLDVTKTDMNKKGLARPDNDYPVSWVREYGKGRVFYCSLGHNQHIFWNATVLRHYLDGIQYALGDLNAEGSPTPKESNAALQQSLKPVLKSLASYEVAQDHRGAGMVQMYIRQTAQLREARQHLAHELATFASADPKTSSHTLASRQFACRCLGNISGDVDASLLAPMLRDPDVRVVDSARMVLERAPDKVAVRTLIGALKEAGSESLVGIINSIGLVRNDTAVGDLNRMLTHSDPSVAEAAAAALGNIGGANAAAVLIAAHAKSSGALKTTVEHATVRAANRVAAEGDAKQAESIYRTILGTDPPSAARLAAFQGLAALPGEGGRELLLDTLAVDDAKLREAATGILLKQNAPVSTTQILEKLKRSGDELRPVLLAVLAQRGDRAALPAVLQYSQPGTTEPVRVAALHALSKLGDRSVVQLLAKTAASEAGVPRDAAREALRTLTPAGVDEEIVVLLEKHSDSAGDEAERVLLELARASGERRIVAAGVPLLKVAGGTSNKLQSAALKAVSEIGDGTRAAEVAALLQDIKSEKVRTDAEQTLLALVRKSSDDQKKQADTILSMLQHANAAASTASLIRVAGNIADDRTLAVVRQSQASSDESIRDAATRTLINYPDASPIEDVLQLARSSDNEIYRTLALRGFARMLGLPADRDTSATMQYCEEALKLAVSAEDKRMVLGALADVTQPGVLQLVLPYMDNADLKEEARVTALKLAQKSWAFLPDDATSAVQVVIDGADKEGQRKDAKKVLKDIKLTSDTITGWQIAGPFSDEKTTSLVAMMEHPFLPETQGNAHWKPAAISNGKDDRETVDLLKVVGGNDRVAYMRVKVWSPEDMDARLEIGSDDSVRAWLNGKMVHATTQERGYQRGSDKLNVTLHEGWNYLMLKVGQTSGDWKAAARFVSRNGKRVPNLKYDALNADGPYVNGAS